MHSVWERQRSSNVNNHRWSEEIVDQNIINLFKKVKLRRPLQRKRNAEEKINGQMAPFYYVQHLGAIERKLWSRGVSSMRRSVFACLRDSFTLKMTLNAIIRGESMEKADLSDLFDLQYKAPKDACTSHILVMQIAQGTKCLSCFAIYTKLSTNSKLSFWWKYRQNQFLP